MSNWIGFANVGMSLGLRRLNIAEGASAYLTPTREHAYI